MEVDGYLRADWGVVDGYMGVDGYLRADGGVDGAPEELRVVLQPDGGFEGGHMSVLQQLHATLQGNIASKCK